MVISMIILISIWVTYDWPIIWTTFVFHSFCQAHIFITNHFLNSASLFLFFFSFFFFTFPFTSLVHGQNRSWTRSSAHNCTIASSSGIRVSRYGNASIACWITRHIRPIARQRMADSSGRSESITRLLHSALAMTLFDLPPVWPVERQQWQHQFLSIQSPRGSFSCTHTVCTQVSSANCHRFFPNNYVSLPELWYIISPVYW